jgi:hypothetical protein
MPGPKLPRELAVAAFAASADLPPGSNGAAHPPGSTVAAARVSAREERAG